MLKFSTDHGAYLRIGEDSEVVTGNYDFELVLNRVTAVEQDRPDTGQASARRSGESDGRNGFDH